MNNKTLLRRQACPSGILWLFAVGILCLCPWLQAADVCLQPGDVAVTRVRPDGITLLFLRSVDAATAKDLRLYFTNRNQTVFGWETETEGSGRDNLVEWKPPAEEIVSGTQVVISFGAKQDSMRLDWGQHLFIFTGSDGAPEFLYSIYFDRDWLIWNSPRRGLVEGVNSIVLGQLNAATTVIDHMVNFSLNTAPGQLKDLFSILTYIGKQSTWVRGSTATKPVEEVVITPTESAGLVQFSAPVYYGRNNEEITITLHRALGSVGAAEVRVNTLGSKSGLTDWVSRRSSSGDASNELTTDDLSAIVYGSGRFVASSAGGALLFSENGVDWEKAYDAAAVLGGLTYGGPDGSMQFVATGGIPGTTVPPIAGKAVIATSSNGKDWVKRELAFDLFLRDIVWRGSSYLAVGYKGKALTSVNAINWTLEVLPTTENLYSVAYWNGVTVAVGENASIVTKIGTLWTKVILPQALLDRGKFALRKVIATDTGFLAVGSLGTILTSTDGLLWTPILSSAPVDFTTLQIAAGRMLLATSNGAIYSFSLAGVISVLREGEKGASAILAFARNNESYYIAVGQYGLILHATDRDIPLTASGNTDFKPLDKVVRWESGDTCPQEIKIERHATTLTPFERKRFDILITNLTPGLLLGRDKATVAIVYDDGQNVLQGGFGGLVRITDLVLSKRLEPLTGVEIGRNLSFRLYNTSNYPSRGGEIEFEGGFLAEIHLGSIPANSFSETYTVAVDGPVRSIAYLENVVSSEEPVFQHRIYINNDFRKSGSVEIKDIQPSIINGGLAMPAGRHQKFDGAGGVRPPPGGNGSGTDYGIYLQSLVVSGPTGVVVPGTGTYTAVGTFVDNATQTTFSEPVIAGWASTPSHFPINAAGEVSTSLNPATVYPLAGTVEAITNEGVPVDNLGNPIPMPASLVVNFTEPAGVTYPQHIANLGLSGKPKATPMEDYDGDGVVNLIEYATGMNMQQPDAYPAPAISFHATNSSQLVGFRRPMGLSGVHYWLEESSDLQSWTLLPLTLDPQSPAGWEYWQSTRPSVAPHYYRLRVGPH
ncbi:MAG: hypothetical protein SFY80_05570 [Verrucomicrobiota bacterium]|nr:hypothetical protein [Verrucomicrobiota bacterium]